MTDDLSRAIAILADLVAFPSVSAAGNLEITAYAADLLDRAGARLHLRHDASGRKANLFASFGPEGGGGTILSAHTDVVPADPAEWTSDPFRLRRAHGRLYGRGTCDMKGFAAAVLALAPGIGAAPLARPIHIALTHDEEVGCHGAQALVADLAARGLRPDMVFVGEPTEMAVVDAHKGCFEYTTRFTGREGHASNPNAGVNAAHHAARFTARLAALEGEMRTRAPSNSPFTPPHTTLQAGRIEGGSARNVIAGHASVEWEMRPVATADAAFAREATHAYCNDVLLPEMRATAPEAAIETEVVGEVAGLERRDANAARDLALALTGQNAAGVVPFGTEAGLYQSLGADTVVCGPGSIAQAHRADEYLSEAALARALAFLHGLVARHR